MTIAKSRITPPHLTCVNTRNLLLCAMLPLLLLAACTHDDAPASPAGIPLPPDTYPLQIASVTISADGQPRTRLTDEGNTTKWQEGDKIGVRIGDDPETGIYKMDVDVQGSLVGITPIKPVYWKNTTPATVTAWYPLDEEIDFTQQDKGLTYLLKAEPVNATYNQSTPIDLTFTHQLAKVRVLLEGKKAQDVTAVYVRSYPKSANNKGELGDREGEAIYVPMYKTTYDGKDCWEATLRDGTLQADNSFQVAKAEGKPVQVKLTDDLPIKAGEVYTITIGVEQAPIDLGTCEGTTLTVSGEAVITGKNDNLQIILQAGADVTLQDAELSYTGLSPILCQGDASLTLAGSNTLTATSVAWNFETGTGIYVENGTLTIDAESGASLAINRTGGGTNQQYGAGIGVTENANLIINGGTIIVNDIDESSGYDSGAGIGGLYDETSGNITIAGGTITIGQPSWWSAGIGGGGSGNCKNITITGSSTVITVAKGSFNDHYIGCSKLGGNVEGTITIGGGATVNGVKYTDEKPHTGPL